jgi:hypothetical protein
VKSQGVNLPIFPALHDHIGKILSVNRTTLHRVFSEPVASPSPLQIILDDHPAQVAGFREEDPARVAPRQGEANSERCFASSSMTMLRVMPARRQ